MSALAGADGDVLEVDFEGSLHSPAQFPLRLSLADDVLTFVQVSRLDYRRASFLDPRGLPGNALLWQAPLSAIHAALPPPEPRSRLAYLFHTGFCCSTLLSRCAEISPEVFALREPMSLHNLEVQLAGAGRDCSCEDWNRALTTVMALLGRTWSNRQTALIKADCTLLVPALLRHFPAPWAVLYCPVRDFLAAVMSSQTRRAWSIGRLRQMIEIARAAGMSIPFEVPSQLGAAEAATLIWWWQTWIFREAWRTEHLRGCFLAADSFLDDPVPSLSTLFGAMDVTYPSATLATFAARVMSRDAKSPAQSLDATSRRQRLADTTAIHAGQIDNALHWASGWIGHDLQAINLAGLRTSLGA